MHPARPITTGARHPTKGFTAIELAVTLAVLAVVTAIAVPSFTSLMERWRVRQAAEDLQSALYFTRSEAIRHAGTVTIGAVSDNWSNGWTVKSGSTLLQQNTVPTNVTVMPHEDSGIVSADRWGVLSDGNTTAIEFNVYPDNKADSPSALRLCAEPAGRIQTKKATESC